MVDGRTSIKIFTSITTADTLKKGLDSYWQLVRGYVTSVSRVEKHRKQARGVILGRITARETGRTEPWFIKFWRIFAQGRIAAVEMISPIAAIANDHLARTATGTTIVVGGIFVLALIKC